jgi:hypothetical protein
MKAIWLLLFYVPLMIFSLIWIRHHYRSSIAKVRPTLGTQGRIVIVPHLLWQRNSVFPMLISSEGPGPPHSVPLTTHKGMLTRILTGTFTNLRHVTPPLVSPGRSCLPTFDMRVTNLITVVLISPMNIFRGCFNWRLHNPKSDSSNSSSS